MWIDGSRVHMKLNGGWMFPGVNYISNRMNAEITLNKNDPESECLN